MRSTFKNQTRIPSLLLCTLFWTPGIRNSILYIVHSNHLIQPNVQLFYFPEEHALYTCTARDSRGQWYTVLHTFLFRTDFKTKSVRGVSSRMYRTRSQRVVIILISRLVRVYIMYLYENTRLPRCSRASYDLYCSGWAKRKIEQYIGGRHLSCVRSAKYVWEPRLLCDVIKPRGTEFVYRRAPYIFLTGFRGPGDDVLYAMAAAKIGGPCPICILCKRVVCVCTT